MKTPRRLPDLFERERLCGATPEAARDALEEAARRLEVEIHVRRLDDDELTIASGACVIKGKGVIVIDRRLDPMQGIDALVAALKQFDDGERYLPPLAGRLLGREEEG